MTTGINPVEVDGETYYPQYDPWRNKALLCTGCCIVEAGEARPRASLIDGACHTLRKSINPADPVRSCGYAKNIIWHTGLRAAVVWANKEKNNG